MATDANGKSYYSYDIAGSNWHIVNLDSQCELVPGGCAAGSAQELWLKADLAANSTKNVIALWHKPRYSSGATDYQAVQPLWDDLYAAGVDILLDGHDHIYERTAPMNRGHRGSPVAIRPTASPSSPSAPAARATTASPRPCPPARSATPHLRHPQAHPARELVRLGVPAHRRFDVHRLGHPCRPRRTCPGNHAPVAVAEGYTTPQDTAKVVAAPGRAGQRLRCRQRSAHRGARHRCQPWHPVASTRTAASRYTPDRQLHRPRRLHVPRQRRHRSTPTPSRSP